MWLLSRGFMAVFKRRLSAGFIQRRFTHKALFMGIVPVYINLDTTDMAVRNGVPDWTFDAVEWIAGKVRGLLRKIYRDYQPAGDFLLTGPIQKDGK